MKVIYIAGKFRGKHSWEIAQNVYIAELHAAAVAQRGAVPLCPHTMYRNYQGLLPDIFWLSGTMELLRRCDAIFMIPGWQMSLGACGERKEAQKLSLPILYDMQQVVDYIVKDIVPVDALVAESEAEPFALRDLQKE